MRIGFLFNHYAVHQVPHAAPYAFELSRKHPEHEVIIACSTREEMDTVEKIGQLYPGHRCSYRHLRPPLAYRVVDPIISKVAFLRKELVLINNLAFFRSIDALVAPERHCMTLRTRYGLDELIMIHTRHGAGDREGGFDEKSGAFDLTILPGQKYVDRLNELGHLSEDRYAVVGWPKFEAVKALQDERKPFFDNDNPTVVYNPHFNQEISSWRPMGVQVLEFFAENPQYNLIFAPHIVLFKRSMRHQARMPGKYETIPNILIDTGSAASVDMTYIMAADIYLGDVSSQVYEFLLELRPCIFLNGHGADWKDNPYYLHWTLGQVVDDVPGQLGTALEKAFESQSEYLPKQQEAFAYTFRTETDSTAAERGADAIAGYLARRGASGSEAAARAGAALSAASA